MKRMILFDLDGTLTDSGEGIINCAEVAFAHFGMPVPSREELRVFVGPPLGDSFRKFGIPEEKTEEAIAIFRSRYTPIGIFENHPYPGILEMLEILRSQGHKLFVATSKAEPMAIKVLEHFDMLKYFDMVCGATLDSSRVSKSDVIAFLLSKSPKDAPMVMVGDTAFDVIGAKAHGIATIGVSWGYGDVGKMNEAGAIAIAHTTEELLNLLNA